MKNINTIFKITDFLDRARWDWEPTEKNKLINYYKPDITAEQKLLTHYITYITNRQIPFQRVWDIGGFVFSEMVVRYGEDGVDVLKPNGEQSFFYMSGDKAEFTSHSKVNDNTILLNEGYTTDDLVVFIPRYIASEYKSILFTLHTLASNEFDRKLSKYIAYVLKQNNDNDETIVRVLFALHLLTYENVKQPKIKEFEYDILISEAEEQTDHVMKLLKNKNEFDKAFNSFKKKTIYSSKRAWCTIRDYLKSPEFKLVFKEALEGCDIGEDNYIFKEENFHQFELPGDVWNNNSKFSYCLFEKEGKINANKNLRDLYNQSKATKDLETGYVEQFDISFDLVPRMCERKACDFCPYGLLTSENHQFYQLCINDKSKYCPVLLFSCGYQHKCYGAKECSLYEIADEHLQKIK